VYSRRARDMQADATMVESDNPAYAGQAVYTRSLLRLYDLFVFGFNFPVLWRCPKKHLLGLYEEHASAHHLDIGVGSGYLLNKGRFPTATPDITLMDLNPNSLEFAARRLQRLSPHTHQADVLAPWTLPERAFGSVGMVNLLHCVPGDLREKGVVFESAGKVLAPGGTLFGATVLGVGIEHTHRSQAVMERFNRKGIFSNLEDSLEDLESGLSSVFPSYDVRVQGSVALFSASTTEG
jgi:SAM-dependent methyltransferase